MPAANASHRLPVWSASGFAPQVILGLLLVGALFAPSQGRGADQQPQWPAEGIEDFSLTECHGQTVTKADLLGRPWLACFIFTHCLGPCPMVSEQMELLQEKLRDLDVRLVTFTVDPDRDTPAVLRNYAKKYNADPDLWWFLTGDKEEIHRLIRGSFKMIAHEASPARPGFEFEHSVTIMHVNDKGRVLGQYNARNDVEMARLRRVFLKKSTPEEARLIADADQEQERQLEQQRQWREQAEREAEAERAAELWEQTPLWVRRLPAVNASLNGLATVLLLAGFSLIKLRRPEAHRTVMLLAFVTSALFLTTYLVYHGALTHYTGSGSRKFAGEGLIVPIYRTLLLSHILLAVVVAVMAPLTIYRGLRQDWARHRRLARITFPIWLYVSVTGVVIYVLLYHW
ncbi:MAG: DUF420 domain-containing protein [Planctomycetales bacterium]